MLSLTGLAAILLLSPLMLGGLAMLSLPLIAHMLHRRTRRQIVFPTIALLKAASSQQSKLFRLRRLLLLLLRALAVTAVVLAFARPLWTGQGATAGSVTAGRTVVIILDASASMRQRTGGSTAFEQARQAAMDAIQQLTPGKDHASVIVAESSARSLLPQPTANLAMLRQEVGMAEASAGRGDLVGAFAIAAEQLASQPSGADVLLISDLQATNWPAADHRAAASLPESTTVQLLPVKVNPPRNLALSRPRLAPAAARPGRVAQVSADLTNHGDTPVSTTAKLYVDGAVIDAQTVTATPGLPEPVVFDWTPRKAGPHSVRITIDADALAIDNELFGAAEVTPHRKVALVSRSNATEPGSAAFFLSRAIAPRGRGADRFAVASLHPAELQPEALSAPVIVLSDVGDVDESQLDAVASAVRRGAVLLWFVSPSDLPAIAQCAEWLPVGRPAAVVPPEGEPALLPADIRGSALDRLLGENPGGLDAIAFHQLVTFSDPDERATRVLQTPAGAPVMLSLPVEKGQAHVVGFTPSRTMSDLGQYAALVGMVQSMIDHAIPSDASLEAGRPGELCTVATSEPLDEGMGVPIMRGPAGKAVPGAIIDRAGSGVRGVIPSARTAGMYRLEQAGQPLAFAAVNVDPHESDLAALDPQIAMAMLGAASGKVAGGGPSQSASLSASPGQPLWHVFLIVAAGLLAAELILLSWWRR